ncbi:alpha/beta-hydrolase [Ascodesmis nigricans]|uniref:Alpha/beta-hydrolase n=1 Tax=Ascodesmis nigricans TaxID=341454 RepID=A0A4S2MUV6_9PEZI|nr:alpha/beta-hydrolase [Ascodesmis nigricans]
MQFSIPLLLSTLFAAITTAQNVANTPPFTPTIPIEPFRVNIPLAKITEMNTLIRLGKLPPPTYEGTNRSLGISSEWMRQAKDQWANRFSWREFESRVNRILPQYIATVTSNKGDKFKLHYAGIFSEDKNAVPLLLVHGWPGSYMEFMDVVEILRKSTNPSYHIIIPSHIGYGFSSPPPIDRDFTLWEDASLINDLMKGLGFEDTGYIVQAGDIGHWTARMLTHYPGCKGILLNFFVPGNLSEPTPLGDLTNLTPEEIAGLQRSAKFSATGSGYAIQQGTRPSTIAHSLHASPLSLLSWLGEKFLDSMEIQPSIQAVLEFASTYWLTETYATCIWMYRQLFIGPDHGDLWAQMQIQKPFGVAQFPREIANFPRSWMEEYGDLVWFKRHEAGGHWPMVEHPDWLAEDIREFTREVWV